MLGGFISSLKKCLFKSFIHICLFAFLSLNLGSFLYFWVFFILCIICKYTVSFCEFFHSCDNILCTEVFNLMRSSVPNFLWHLCFWCHTQEILAKSNVTDFPLCFPLRSFSNFSTLMFRYLIHFEIFIMFLFMCMYIYS